MTEADGGAAGDGNTAGPGESTGGSLGSDGARNGSSAESAESAPAEFRLWGGRTGGGPAASLDDLNRSLPVDIRLWRDDITCSVAWVEALGRARVLSADETETLSAGLEKVADRIGGGGFEDAPDEDIHTLVERLLHEEVGALAGKLHTGRSRNDQAVTDTRYWAKRTFGEIEREMVGLGSTLIGRAEGTIDLIMPSYTHLRRAQPIRVAHWLLSHFWALQRDRERLRAAIERTAMLPLGSGAVAGSGFQVDRQFLKERLGFSSVSPNSLDAIADRDWVAELVFCAALTVTHLSRLAEDLIVFSTDEFGFVRLPDEFTTGSSLMPQKRNPDGLELARGLAARLIGDSTAALAMLKGLPTGYNKDLQEDKRVLFSAADSLALLLPATTGLLAGLTFQSDALADAASDEALLATDLADALVKRGVPFRQAHGIIGRLLREAEADGVAPSQLAEERWTAVDPALTEGGRPELSAEASVEAHSVYGGTGRNAVLSQIREAWSSNRS